MMKAPTLFFCLLATASSLASAVPFERRQFNKLQASQAKLNEDVAKFTQIASTLNIAIDLDIQLGPILNHIIGDYQDCDSALEKNGKLSDSQAQEVLGQYRDSSSTFTNGLNEVHASRRNAPFANVQASVSALGTSVQASARAFGNQVSSQSPQNGANQKQASDINNGLQNAIQQALIN